METIFDYNPTDTELQRFGGRDAIQHLKSCGIDITESHDDRLYQLGLLFLMRGHKKRADQYFSQIQDRNKLNLLFEDF